MLAFIGIIAGGICGMFVGWKFTEIQCGGTERVVMLGRARQYEPPQSTAIDQDSGSGCQLIIAGGTIAGAAIGASGIAVVSVLVLRAMGEWRKELAIEPDPSETFS